MYYDYCHNLTNLANTTGSQAIIKGEGHQYFWLVGGYGLEIGHF